jgi:predicted DNA-binding transcriptional regulator AlpA
MTVVSDTPTGCKSSLRLLRFADLKALGIVLNWTTIHRGIAKGQFPPGRYLGPSTRVWTEEEIVEWLASRPTSKAGAA